MTIFATLTPIDLGTNSRVTVRVCADGDPDSTGAANERWWPAISAQPVIQSRFFDGDFTSSVEPATAAMEIRLDVLMAGGAYPGVERYDWAGASCRLQRLSAGALVDVQVMQVESFAAENMVLGLRLKAAGDLFDAEVLRSRYAGTTGAEGTADLKGQLKPWVFGRARNIEPVAINQVDSVFQVSGYGPVQAISAVYERGASFGASIGDYATYAALVAATIPPGRWATCLAQGMFRLGAPPAGVITCDVDGDNTGGFLRRTGAILTEIAGRIGLSGKVSGTSMAALDSAVARNVNILLREQISFIELAQRMLAPCNAVGSVGADGRLIASRVVFGSEQFTLDAQGREMPAVLGMARQNTSAPYKRVQLGAARSWRVHSFDEIAFYAELVDRGLYDAATTYREGNIVDKIDKSRWLYINPTPSSGNAPPTFPVTANAYWQSLAPPASQDPGVANDNVVLRDTLTNLPGTGDFDGQIFQSTDTKEIYVWNRAGSAWIAAADVTAVAQREIVPQFPIIEVRQGEAGHTGSRIVTHTAKRGTAALIGGSWGLPAQSLGAGSATINSTTGAVTLSGIVQSGSYTIRYTHSDGLPTDLAVNVTYIPSTASNPAFASGAIANFASSAFAAVTSVLQIVLPTGVTSATLTAANVELSLPPEAPDGSTTAEFKWQRETSPGSGSWVDVGSVATSSPSPSVSDTGLTDGLGNPLYTADAGLVTCTRTASGLTAGSTQNFRLVARVSAGNVRTVIASGTASASA